MRKTNEQISFLLTTPLLSTLSQFRIMPFDGKIERITISFPAGCAFLVEVMFNYKREQILPYPTLGVNRGIVLDDFTDNFLLDYFINRGERLEMVVVNHDGAFPHTISAIAHITEGDFR
jgi:hypothetical protein